MTDRNLALSSVIGTLTFMALIGVSMSLYPGGTWFNRRAEGHSFTHNFLCDLMQSRALNGIENPVGSLITRIAMIVILIAIAAFFLQVARYGDQNAKSTKVTRYAGVFSCVVGCSVPLVQADWWFVAHLTVVVASFIPALVATIAAYFVCLRTKSIPWWIRAFAILTLSTATLDFVLYVLGYGMAFGIVPSVQTRLLNSSLPVIQRVATLGMLAWVIAVGVNTLRCGRILPSMSKMSGEGADSESSA